MVGIEDDGLPELSVEAVALGAEAVVVLGEVVKLSAVVGAVNRLNDAGGVAVERLTRSSREGGLTRDGAVGAVEDSGGVGDAKWRR